MRATDRVKRPWPSSILLHQNAIWSRSDRGRDNLVGNDTQSCAPGSQQAPKTVLPAALAASGLEPFVGAVGLVGGQDDIRRPIHHEFAAFHPKRPGAQTLDGSVVMRRKEHDAGLLDQRV